MGWLLSAAGFVHFSTRLTESLKRGVEHELVSVAADDAWGVPDHDPPLAVWLPADASTGIAEVVGDDRFRAQLELGVRVACNHGLGGQEFLVPTLRGRVGTFSH